MMIWLQNVSLDYVSIEQAYQAVSSLPMRTSLCCRISYVSTSHLGLMYSSLEVLSQKTALTRLHYVVFHKMP